MKHSKISVSGVQCFNCRRIQNIVKVGGGYFCKFCKSYNENRVGNRLPFSRWQIFKSLLKSKLKGI